MSTSKKSFIEQSDRRERQMGCQAKISRELKDFYDAIHFPKQLQNILFYLRFEQVSDLILFDVSQIKQIEEDIQQTNVTFF